MSSKCLAHFQQERCRCLAETSWPGSALRASGRMVACRLCPATLGTLKSCGLRLATTRLQLQNGRACAPACPRQTRRCGHPPGSSAPSAGRAT
eukprot:365779-Chlamydomonas_euryale.AAC.6